MSVGRRIASALAASAFGQAVTIGSQILLTPLYFKFWGAALYGEWLILSSIPAYLTMADLGIGSAAGNEMTMRAGAGDRAGARQTYASALWVAGCAGVIVCLFGLGAAALAYRWQVPTTPSMAPGQAALVLLGLAFIVALGFVGGVVSAGFRCCGRNALGIMLGNLGRLAEAAVTAVLLVAGQPPAVLCGGLVLTRAGVLVLQLLFLRQVGPWLSTAGVRADRGMIRRLITPALGFLAFPLGNALALQGPILIIGAVLGGPAVAMFSTLRTLARVPIQITSMFNASVWPEMSLAYGSGHIGQLRELHRMSWGITSTITIVLCIALGWGGSWIVAHWLGPNAPFNALVFGVLLALTCASAVWNASAVVLTATNQHLRLSAMYVGFNGVCILAAALLTSTFGWAGLLLSLTVAELGLLVWVLPVVLTVTADTFRSFVIHAPASGFRKVFQR